MSDAAERIRLTDLIVAAATEQCVAIHGPAPVSAGPWWPERHYTSREILDAEQLLLASNADLDASRLAFPLAVADAAAGPAITVGSGGPIRILATDQRQAVVEVTTSGRQVDVLVGPAGAGKTATLAVIRSCARHHSHLDTAARTGHNKPCQHPPCSGMTHPRRSTREERA